MFQQWRSSSDAPHSPTVKHSATAKMPSRVLFMFEALGCPVLVLRALPGAPPLKDPLFYRTARPRLRDSGAGRVTGRITGSRPKTSPEDPNKSTTGEQISRTLPQFLLGSKQNKNKNKICPENKTEVIILYIPFHYIIYYIVEKKLSLGKEHGTFNKKSCKKVK